MRERLCSLWGLWLLATCSLGAASPATSLIDAVKAGDVKAITALIGQKADANARETDGTTALHWAARRNDEPTVELLLSARAEVNTSNRYGVTPLSLACINGNPAIVERLLTAGADPNSTRPEGETALMTAARSGNAATVRALLAHGARVNAVENWRGQTALMWAAAENNADVARALIEAGATLDTRSKAGFTALLFAARAGQIDSAGALLEAGADVNEVLPNGMASLTLAIVNARYELAAFLLDYGADPNADGPGWTALHQLVWTRRPHVGFNNPEPVQVDSFDSLELVRKMIAYGADPNARIRKDLEEQPRTGLSGLNRTGATPFFLAAKDCDVELMRVLAENGADPLRTNADNSTPLMVAAGVGIFTPGEDPGTNEEALEAVKLALKLGGSVTAVDDRGETALHGAAARGANALVEFLVEQGARLDAKNRRGWTPQTIADGVVLGGTFKRQPETASLLRRLTERSAVAVERRP